MFNLRVDINATLVKSGRLKACARLFHCRVSLNVIQEDSALSFGWQRTFIPPSAGISSVQTLTGM